MSPGGLLGTLDRPTQMMDSREQLQALAQRKGFCGRPGCSSRLRDSSTQRLAGGAILRAAAEAAAEARVLPAPAECGSCISGSGCGSSASHLISDSARPRAAKHADASDVGDAHAREREEDVILRGHTQQVENTKHLERKGMTSGDELQPLFQRWSSFSSCGQRASSGPLATPGGPRGHT